MGFMIRPAMHCIVIRGHCTERYTGREVITMHPYILAEDEKFICADCHKIIKGHSTVWKVRYTSGQITYIPGAWLLPIDPDDAVRKYDERNKILDSGKHRTRDSMEWTGDLSKLPDCRYLPVPYRNDKP